MTGEAGATGGGETARDSIGVVVIGRNEGERLRRCLASILGAGVPVVYADSGSSDGSAALARSMGASVVELDASAPHTAARGRNAGFDRLLTECPGVEFVQFVDGDCELRAGWLGRAASVLAQRADAAIVCGQVREKFADRSVYARLLDMDWNGSAGEVAACGGIFAVRVSALRAIGGFASELATGEEAELCARLRSRGHVVLRLDEPMCTHDGDIHTFRAWWQRTVRIGRTYARALRADHREPGAGREVASAAAWGALMPIAALAGAAAGVADRRLFLVPALVLLAYAMQAVRVARARASTGAGVRHAGLYAAFTPLTKVAQFVGCMRFWIRG